MKSVDYSVPVYVDAEHDAVSALTRWLEGWERHRTIFATKFNNDSAPVVGSQRLLCVHPEVARSDVKGDVDETGSWTC